VNDGDIRALLDRLVVAPDDEVGDWEDVLERSAPRSRAPEPRRRRRPGRPGWGLLLISAAVVAAALVLTVTSPWRGGPRALDRAAAAVLVPTPGQILYESITIRPSTSGARGGVTHVHVWIDGAPPHRFRVTFDGPRPADVGGTLGGVTGLSYAVSHDVLDPVAFAFPISQSDLDPAAFIKNALASGRAKLDGTTKVGGRPVLRIRVSSRDGGRLVPIALYFVDAHTYRPVRAAILPTPRLDPNRLGFPLSSFAFPQGGFFLDLSRVNRRYPFVGDFVEYRYFAATAANRKLANIQAMHPHAPIV
jgi:hypothetical protein